MTILVCETSNLLLGFYFKFFFGEFSLLPYSHMSYKFYSILHVFHVFNVVALTVNAHAIGRSNVLSREALPMDF